MSLSRTVFRTLPLTAAVMLAFASSAQAQSLVEMYEAARGYDAGFISAKAQFEANLARANQTLGGILPTITASVAKSKTDPETTTIATSVKTERNFETKVSGVTLTQPIYRPAAFALYRQGGRLLQQSAAQFESAEHDLLLKVTQAYFDALVSEDSLELIRAQKKAVQEQLASAQRNFDVGTATITGVRDAQARFDLASAQEIAAENDLRTKQLALNLLTGLINAKPKKLVQHKNLLSMPSEDVMQWVNIAETNNPLVKKARLEVEVADLKVDEATAGHKPTLDALVKYERTDNINGTIVSPSPTIVRAPYAEVRLSVPLFAGFSTMYKVKEAYALKDKAQADLENARRSTEQSTRNAFMGLAAGLSQVKAYEAAEASSQSALDANKLGYSVGVNINIDVLNSQSQLYQTKRDLAKARYDVLVTNLKLRQAAGTLTPADLQPINDLLAP
jgi:outer membrane protein